MTRRPWIFVNKERADDGLKGQSQQAPAFKNVMDVIHVLGQSCYLYQYHLHIYVGFSYYDCLL